uniref:Anaphase-promoting complex subunit 4 WD40 domain-containing protein n=1 Tax=Chlamydomonas leiostraca TaxID=1034604 RepID=A0A7S0S261_9CHLO|mmetsp:Transcript_4033/g.10057  ORF Transcript_4033/g.10057 Transcript_4033/m.10057 type:complete len:358 (+) Transcript_4033:149-1222(+)
MAEKRSHEEVDGHVEDVEDDHSQALTVTKKAKLDDNQIVVGSVTKDGIKRTSNLQAPTMQLTGHAGEVYSIRFSPDGKNLASSSFDKDIFLWHVYGECNNFAVLKGHKNAVLEVHWMPGGEQLITCSADKTVRGWDAVTNSQIKKYKEHEAVVNSVCPLRRGPPLVVSASDDCTAKLWDMRTKKSVSTFNEKFQVTAAAFAEAGDQIYTGGLDNTIKVWDLRADNVVMTLKGHSDTVTGMSLSPDGSHLLTNSMDNTLRVWDMRPYAPQNRCVKMFTGHMHSFEKLLLRCAWSPDGKQVTCGSSDRMVYIWDAATCKMQYKLPGHTGSVNECVFHPQEPVIASASSDRTIFLGELMR